MPAGRRCGPGGRLVANVVTLEGEAALLALAGRGTAASWCRIEVARVERVGSYHGWRPALPVTQLAALKP